MSALGKKYINRFNQVVLYSIAPHGTIICKRIGTFKWIPSAMSREEFDQYVANGSFRVYQGV